ncbi:MAG: DNA methylase [Anaerolineae bacterium]|nr:DNA methylase [Anaerolineae bacterium]
MTDQPYLLEPKSEYHPDDDVVRRAAYRERLRAYLRDPEFRAIEGFPIAEDEAIMALSDPPYYTACPNPFLPEILAAWEEERRAGEQADESVGEGGHSPYHREPFAADVSEGKNDPIYNAHSYHTKVPHKAIMRYILHYTEPGDVVFDGFCGTGMTGVAAQLCGDRKAVESLGYVVDYDGNIYDPSALKPGQTPPAPVSLSPNHVSRFTFHETGTVEATPQPFSHLGARKAILVDLSPAATFIAYNYNTPVDTRAFEREAKRILREVEEECGWMYETWHPNCDDPNRVKGRINYTVWSDVFVCPQCGEEMVFWELAVTRKTGKVKKDFICPSCGTKTAKRNTERAWVMVYDQVLGIVVKQAKQISVLINYSVAKNRYEKKPDIDDLALIQKIQNSEVPYWFPTNRMPEGDEARRNDDIGITHIHHFYTQRNLYVMTSLYSRVKDFSALMFGFPNTAWHATIMRRFNARGGDRPLSGTLYVPSLPSEANMLDVYEHKIRQLRRFFFKTQVFKDISSVAIGTQSSSKTAIANNTVDYIFVDPPFGGNLMYSELNFLWETWLRILTNSQSEAIINKVQNKKLPEYQRLMEFCFSEFYRILKPGRWMTVEFHNSQNRVWNAIQEALLRAGFMIADVRTLDKQQGSFKQYTIMSTTKQDLIISAYKPNDGLEERFKLEAGTPEGAWDFVRQHLGKLPVVVAREEAGSEAQEAPLHPSSFTLEVLAERQSYLLFDRMVAFHIQRGVRVPLSAAEFYQGLRERFVERDGMYFLPNQTPDYDRARLEAGCVAQLSLFVNDEKSAIQWLKQQLDPALEGTSMTYQDLQPLFLRALHQASHEAMPELTVLLEQNFLLDEAGCWRVPDPHRVADLELIRRKALLREFNTYLEDHRRLRTFRSEAVRAGFADAWQRNDYPTIIHVAERLPDRVLQEDAELLMYYDNAVLRM